MGLEKRGGRNRLTRRKGIGRREWQVVAWKLLGRTGGGTNSVPLMEGLGFKASAVGVGAPSCGTGGRGRRHPVRRAWLKTVQSPLALMAVVRCLPWRSYMSDPAEEHESTG